MNPIVSYVREYRTMLCKEDTHPLDPQIKKRPLTSPDLVVLFLRSLLAMQDKEIFGMLMVNSMNKLVGMAVLSIGTLDRAPVYVREVCKMAVLTNAAAVILYHNHPSGEMVASKEDITLTEVVVAGLKSCGVTVHDHIIVGESKHFSFRNEGLL